MILNEQEIVQRINELIADSELKKSAFAVEAGIDASNFNKKLSGKLKFTDSDIKRIIAYTNVNIEWLMFGKGGKYGLTNENESTENNKKRNDVSLKKENTSSVKIRLKQAMEALELSPYSLATVCDGITKNMLQTLWNSETDTVTTNVLEPFCKHYTQINCNWLMRGEGSMFINQSEATSISNNEDAKIKQLEARIAAMSRSREQQDKAYELILSMLDVVSKTYNFFEQK